jgi:hypothetical protein
MTAMSRDHGDSGDLFASRSPSFTDACPPLTESQ